MKATFKAAIFAALLIFTLGLYAQQPGQRQMPSPEQRATELTERMKEKLTLSEDQTKQVQAINLKYAGRNQEIFALDASREDKMAKIRALQTEKNAELKAVLTGPQYKAYEKNIEELQGMRGGGSGARRQ